jgi:hypothetical protein
MGPRVGQLRRKIRFIEVNSQCKMSSSKRIHLLGTSGGSCLSEFIDWRWSQFLAFIQSCWYFQLSVLICTLPCCPSHLLSGSNRSTLPLPPSLPVWDSGPQTDKHLPQCSFRGQFFLMTTFCTAFYESYLSTVSLFNGIVYSC